MKRAVVVIAAVMMVALVVQVSSAGSGGKDVLEFDTMLGVDGPFVGTTNPVRDVPGGGLPWQIERGRGELRANGELRVSVEGLVLLDGPPVPEDLQGTNPVPTFRAIVSCLTVVAGAVATSNVSTEPFPASPEGDARIRAKVVLPHPCLAPIVFVTSPTGAWFAATGV
jgi:hypothetical protein